jgi:cytochrome c oxidase cbb3-type subunit 3
MDQARETTDIATIGEGETKMNAVVHTLLILIVLMGACEGGVMAAKESAVPGKQLYVKYCMVCHGASGKGDGHRLFNPPPADLTSASVRKKLDSDLLKTIHDGRTNTAMGTWQWVLSGEEAREVLAYVRSLPQ